MKTGRLLSIIFALMGAAAGFAVFVIFYFGGPYAAVSITGSRQSVPRPGRNDSLTVTFFHKWSYTRTAPSWTEFEDEIMFWRCAAPTAFILGGAIGSGIIGYLAGRCRRGATRTLVALGALTGGTAGLVFLGVLQRDYDRGQLPIPALTIAGGAISGAVLGYLVGTWLLPSGRPTPFGPDL